MKKKLIRNIRSTKYYSVVTAISWGLFTIIALICICAVCMSKLDVPKSAVYAASCFSLGMGGYISGYVCGKIKRHKGIVSGLICGLWLWGIVTVMGIVYMRSVALIVLIKNIIFLCVPAIVGGIYGVNKKNYRPPYN